MVAGTAIGGLASLAGAFLSSNASRSASFRQYKYQKALQEQAALLNYNYSLKSAENMPTSTRAGLENAGYNPMLAVQNSTGGANANFTSAGTAGSFDESGAINGAVSNAVQFANSINQEKQVDSTVKANEANAFKTRIEGLGQQIKNKYLDKRETAEIGETNASATKLQSDTLLNNAKIENMQSRLELDRQLGFAGLDVQRRGQDKALEGTIYNADTNERNNIRANETQRGTRTDRLPFGFGSTYYDMRGNDPRMRANDINDRKYWRNYY